MIDIHIPRGEIYIQEKRFTFKKRDLHSRKEIYIQEERFTFKKRDLHSRRDIYIQEV